MNSLFQIRKLLGKFRRQMVFPILFTAIICTALFMFTESIRRNGVQGQEDELKTRLKATVQNTHSAIEMWSSHRFIELERWASDPVVISSMQKLVKISRSGHPENIVDAEAQKILHDKLQDMMNSSNYIHFAVLDDNLTLLASDQGNNYLGLNAKISPDFVSALRRGRSGKPAFMARRIFGSGLNAQPKHYPEHVSFFVVPLQTREGQFLGLLGVALDAHEYLDRLLSVGQWSESGETYAFNSEGILLSESRFRHALISHGLLREADASALHLRVANPGKALTLGVKDIAEQKSWPLTQGVSTAIAYSGDEQLPRIQGLISNSYRDYRGRKVYGAYIWDYDLNFGIISEIDAKEGRFLSDAINFGFFALYALAVLAIAVYLFSFRRSRERRVEGQRMGPYTLLLAIGEGGLGRVYLARHEMLKRPTAVKIIRNDFHDLSQILSFEREVRACSQLSHPNTIAIYDFGRATDGRFYYAMECLTGINLEKLLKIEKVLPVNRAIHFLLQVCASLHEAHTVGLVHRDIKPLNIMVCKVGTEYDFIKVLDFGLARSSENLSEVSAKSEDEGYFSGTLLYMAPERFHKPERFDPRTDIYSLGVIAYRMLSGQDLFKATRDFTIMYDIMYTKAKDIRSFRGDLDNDLAEIVMSCLSKDPQKRPSSMQVLRERLSALIARYPWTTHDAETWWSKRTDLLPRYRIS